MKLRDGTTVRVGLPVVCDREAPPRGTWKTYTGRRGKVASINHRDGEIGVSWQLNHPRPESDAWFLPEELMPA
jgi:hypothetical protein